jgi:hypothetical protein
MHAELRLNEAPGPAPHGHNRPPGQRRVCTECGDPFDALQPHGLFCSNTCRGRFNNRRLQRGAEIYDLIMALRYERGLAKGMHLWTAICRLASAFRAEDQHERAGRKSWRAPKDVISAKPFLTASVMLRRGKKETNV